MRYTVKLKQSQFEYIDSMHSDDLENCINYAEWNSRTYQQPAKVYEGDKEVWNGVEGRIA